MFHTGDLVLLWITLWLWGQVSAKHGASPISSELFNSLEELSRLVDVSYCVGTTGVQEPFECLNHCAEFPNLELVTTWNTGVLLSDSCGYIALSHPPSAKRIIVAFRGTYSIANTIVDLSVYPQPYLPYTGNEGDDDGVSKTQLDSSAPRCENCTVHAGFMTSWLNTRSTVLSYVSMARGRHPDYELVLVGHSLGGAVAALAGLEMRLKGWSPEVTTFGQPMIGNDAFANFMDDQFDMRNSTKDSIDMTTQRFRRVTHVGDPVPLLPLLEWGYRPHAGEIYISKSDLPPSLQDVQTCIGDQDPRCIAGSETLPLLLDIYRDINLSLDCPDSGLDRCRPCSDGSGSGTDQQLVLRNRHNRDQVESANCNSHDTTTSLSPRHWDWSLIPSRYRLWELFHAHRDYFWRIGLCVPGGDPTG